MRASLHASSIDLTFRGILYGLKKPRRVCIVLCCQGALPADRAGRVQVVFVYAVIIRVFVYVVNTIFSTLLILHKNKL